MRGALMKAEKQVSGGVPRAVYKEYFFGSNKFLGIAVFAFFFLA